MAGKTGNCNTITFMCKFANKLKKKESSTTFVVSTGWHYHSWPLVEGMLSQSKIILGPQPKAMRAFLFYTDHMANIEHIPTVHIHTGKNCQKTDYFKITIATEPYV